MKQNGLDETRRLTTLLEISQHLSGTSNLKHSLHLVLEALERHHDMFRSTVVLFRDDSDVLYIEAANGLSAEGQKVQYRVGEGITGRVVESGKPIIVPQVSREPMLLNRAAQRKGLKEELSFICVPIIVGRKSRRRARRGSAVQARPRLRPHGEVSARRRRHDRPGGQGSSA